MKTCAPVALVLALASQAFAPAYADGDRSIVSKDELASRYQGLSAENIHDGPFHGLYQVAEGTSVNYVTTDGRYLIRGEIIDLETQKNLTQATLNDARAKLFAAIDPESEIVYSPEGEVKHRVYVLTDVDCGYCRQFHREIATVTALGIEVRYLSYPRTGPNTDSWAKAENVWCAVDRRTALTAAKRGETVMTTPGCTTTPIPTHYELGLQIGIVGTPGIYTESGVDLGGYFPPDELAMRLDRLAAKARE